LIASSFIFTSLLVDSSTERSAMFHAGFEECSAILGQDYFTAS